MHNKTENRIKEEQNHETDREDEKNLAILGGVLIGIGLIAAIGMQFGPKPSGEDVLPGTGGDGNRIDCRSWRF